jgi:hypothetical protein
MVGKTALIRTILTKPEKPEFNLTEADYSSRTGISNNEIQSDAVLKSLIRKLDIR